MLFSVALFKHCYVSRAHTPTMSGKCKRRIFQTKVSFRFTLQSTFPHRTLLSEQTFRLSCDVVGVYRQVVPLACQLVKKIEPQLALRFYFSSSSAARAVLPAHGLRPRDPRTEKLTICKGDGEFSVFAAIVPWNVADVHFSNCTNVHRL